MNMTSSQKDAYSFCTALAVQFPELDIKPTEKEFVEYNEHMQVKSYVAFVLRKAADINHAKEMIIHLITETSALTGHSELTCSELKEAYKDAIIRKDFAAALRNVKKGTELSWPLGFGFNDEDIIELAKLHKANKFRKKIEDLLEDCNFHYECGKFANHDYSEWIA